MRKVVKRSLQLIISTISAMVLLASCSTKTEIIFSKLTAVKIQLLQNALEQYQTKYHIPGVSISIIVPNSDKVLTLTSGIKNINSNEAITADTLFQICSITKVYTSTLVFHLISEGKLKLSQPVGDWLPQFKQWKKVTIKQLLNMHSGIPSFTENKQFNAAWQRNPRKFWTPLETLEYVMNKPLLYQPGTQYNYSDTNYILLGMIIEKASGKSYSQLLKHNIIEPLHLKKTFYIPREYTSAELNIMATGYSKDNKDVMSVNMSQAGTAGAIIATTGDTAIFFHSIFEGHLIHPKELKAMLVPYSINSGQKINANPKMFEAWAVGIDQIWMPNVGLVWNKVGGFVGFFASANYSIRGHVTIVLAANKWVPKAFFDRVFISKLYKIIGIG